MCRSQKSLPAMFIYRKGVSLSFMVYIGPSKYHKVVYKCKYVIEGPIV